MAEKRVMKKVYYNPAHPGSFGGVERLCKAVEDETGEKVKTEQDAYTLHKPARVCFTRNRVFVTKPLNQFQADLCDMQALVEHNNGYRYLLTVIDVFSKKAYARALKKKTAGEVVEAVFRESQIPEKLQTDAGKEQEF